MVNESLRRQLTYYERIIKAAVIMTDEEKAALATWEKANVIGDGDVATSDWPGWDDIIARLMH